MSGTQPPREPNDGRPGLPRQRIGLSPGYNQPPLQRPDQLRQSSQPPQSQLLSQQTSQLRLSSQPPLSGAAYLLHELSRNPP